MKAFLPRISLCIAFITCIANADAQFNDIVVFDATSAPKGANPYGNVIRAGNSLFGLTLLGGANNDGVIFSVDTNGNNYRDLLDFNGAAAPKGANPYGSLTISGHTLFGMTNAGGASGNGVIFSIDTDGADYRDLYDFPGGAGGAIPYGSLIIVGNKLFGMTKAGGIYVEGNIFSIDTNGLGYKDVWDFKGVVTNGEYPYGSLVRNGYKLYGMTQYGGANNDGIVFSIDTNGTAFKDLVDFNDAINPMGAYPRGSLLLSGEELYGMTENGGISNDGVIFSVDTNGSNYKDMLDFTGANGMDTYGDVVQRGNKLYGMAELGGTHGNGNIFSIDTNGSGFVQVFDFNGPVNGNKPLGDLLISGNMVYGMAYIGATHNYGAVFAFDPFVQTKIIDTNISCHGGNNGRATAVVTGGIRPYTYLWSPSGGTDSTAHGLSAGTYTVYVHDNYDNPDSAVVTLTQPNALSASASITANELCNGGSNGSASASVTGGTGVYTYAWTPSGGTNSTASGLSAGTYVITVHDSCGASSTASVTITQPTVLNVSANTTSNISCNGGSNGSVSSTVSGGTGAYTYLWNPGGGNNPTESGLTAATYTLLVTDNNGCTASASTIVTQPGVLGITIASVNGTSACASTGSIIANAATGGTLAYSYNWTPSGGTNLTASGLSAGTYTITVTDNNGCTASASATVTQPPAVSITIASQVDVLCNGNSTGSITANTATGGNSPYAYNWTPSGGTNLIASSLSAGTYVITVTDNNGCTASATATITQPNPLSISIASQTDELCNGGSTGNITANAATGGATPYAYNWTPSGGTNLSAINLSAGTYVITVTDNNGCTSSASATLTQPTPVSVSIASQTDELCNGGNNGSITANAASGGTPTYSYNWTPSGGTNLTASSLTAGSYTVTATDNNGCTASASAIITEPTSVSITIASVINSGGCVPNGSITANAATGGSGSYTYAWTPAGGTNLTTTSLGGGTYTITATDVNGCTATAEATITQPVIVSISIATIINVPCNGGVGSITANPASGGIPPYTYSWTPSGGTNLTATGLSAGTYFITATDNTGCSNNAFATITQPNALTATANIVANETCNGGNTGSLSSTVGGGTIPYTYAWTPSGGTNSTATGLTAGSYTLMVTDNNGCTASSSATITEPAVLTATANVTANETCNGGNMGSLSSALSGGTTPYTYSWSGGGGTNSTVSGLTAGTYTLTVHDACGATSTSSATITQPNVLSASASESAGVGCHGGNNGTASSSVSGGTSPFTYSWSGGGGTNTTASGLSAGTYTLTVQDACGATSTSSVSITQPAAISVVQDSLSASSGTACNGSAWVTVSGGTGPYVYLWNSGQTTDSIFGQCPGSHCCKVTDAHGCKDSICIDVTVTGIDNVTANSEQISIYPNPNNGNFTMALSGTSDRSVVEVYNMLGQQIFAHSLVQGDNNMDISSQPNGVYMYRIISENGDLLGQGKLVIQK